MLVAVPPITNAESRQANLDNPYHLNIWSPRQWHYVLSQYFEEIECFRHHIELPNYELDFCDTPETSLPVIEDFQFLPISLESLSLIGALTAIFVVNRKRQNLIFPSTNLSYKMIDDSYTRTTYPKAIMPVTWKHRFIKAFQMVKSNQWSALKQAVRGYIQWR